MLCAKCGQKIMEGAAFCPYCGGKVGLGEIGLKAGPGETGLAVGLKETGSEELVYKASVKRAFKSGTLLVYRDRTEFVSSSVQKATFYYTGLVSVKKEWDHIDFITEDGHTESCPADRKCVHEAFLYIEQVTKPYIAQRKDRLLSQGVRYSFPSSQGLMSSGVLSLSAEQAEFRAKSGKNDVVSYRDVKSVSAPMGTLDFILFGGGTKSFSVSKELRDEVLKFVSSAIAPYLAQRKAELLARGIYFSFFAPDGGTVDVLADRVERKDRSGQAESVSFQDVRTASVYAGALELALTDGTSRSFPIDEDARDELLAFVKEAIEPYVAARTVGFDTVFGIDERIEINEERGVFHIIRQSGREITGEWPLEALTRCEWEESRELNALGSVVSGGIALFKSAAKAAGNQAAAEAEDRLSCAGVVLTLSMEQGPEMKKVWFGLFPAGMSRTNKKYDQYLAEWTGLSDYLREHLPECELVEPAAPEDQPPESEPDAEAGGQEGPRTEDGTDETPEPSEDLDEFQQQDDLGLAKYMKGVSRFIGNCPTPMAIAFQGNRGSGESSIFRMLFNQLRRHYGDRLLWLNVRQFAQGESGEALSVLFGKKLAGLFSVENDGDAKSRAANIAAGMLKLVAGAIAPESSAGDDLVDGIFDHGSAGSVDQLVRLFSKQVEERAGEENDRVVLFVDGLDQLLPSRAVELLNAMRDYLGCRGCVFVIAADYDDILSGAREHYDEVRAKRFFDGIFKMSFRVPASSFDVRSYIKGKLEGMGLRTEDDGELDLCAELIQNSVGNDPELIDRLFHSFQLLKAMVDEEVYESRYKRLALFALLCMQTRFREVYDYAAGMRSSVTPEFLTGLCGDSEELWNAVQAWDEEKAAYREFGKVFARVVNLDDEAEISAVECRAFAEVLELSNVTSR